MHVHDYHTQTIGLVGEESRMCLVKSFIKGFSVGIIYETGKTCETAL